DVSRLARMARQAECVAQLAAADVEFRVADQAVVDQRIVVAQQSGGEEKRTAERRLHQYEEKAVAARKSLESARSAVGELGEAYTPVTGVYPTESTGRRAALAHWLTAPKNPLFARVAVNHIWNRHFGRPLVESVFDFGLNGKLPTHPALLDWLAAELMQPTSVASPSNTQESALQPWSMKHLHRMLVTSSVYRMAIQPTRDQVALDPDNQFWTRMPVRRMEAEIVRDSVLFLAGHLSMEMGGADIDESLGFAVPRRSMYFRHAAEKEMTFLKIFDASTVNECYLRKSSIMPQQALAMVNSELTIVQSRRLARRGHLSVPEDDTTFIENAFEHLLSRSVKPLERETCLKFLSQRASEPTSAELAVSINDLTRPAAESSLRAREQLLHVLLNHHEFVTIN
ncbi:MAG: DUF1553 domain-containing protein, partial [Planctomycetota bacterium]|nr:DUF1553 domain-containing protein [Planctomycetota bacterium]